MKAGEKIRPFQVSNELLGQWEKGNSQKKKCFWDLEPFLDAMLVVQCHTELHIRTGTFQFQIRHK